MDWTLILWTIVVPAAMLGLTMGARWLAVRYSENLLLSRAFAFVETMGERARDKYLVELAEAKAPGSPGGVTVTAEEMSQLRAKVWQIAVAEAPKAIRDVLTDDIGAEQGKAIIGAKIREASAGAAVPAAAPVSAQG